MTSEIDDTTFLVSQDGIMGMPLFAQVLFYSMLVGIAISFVLMLIWIVMCLVDALHTYRIRNRVKLSSDGKSVFKNLKVQDDDVDKNP